MIGFPLDNTEYDAPPLGAWFGTRTRGVLSADDHFAVTANGDMSVTLGPGIAWLKPEPLWGLVVVEDKPTVMPVGQADGSLTRYAAICIQQDKNLNISQPTVKYGPYGTNPDLSSLPLPVQDSLDSDEIYVCAVKIRAGATEILQSDITDLRLNEIYCGVVRDGITKIPTQSLSNEWTAWFAGFKFYVKQWADNLGDLLDDNAEAQLANKLLELEKGLNFLIENPGAETIGPFPLEPTEWTKDSDGDDVIRVDDSSVIPNTNLMCVYNEKFFEVADNSAEGKAYFGARIFPKSQGEGFVILKAWNGKPTIEVRIVLKFETFKQK